MQLDILTEELREFKISELLFIKNNLKFGKDHLSKRIGEEEFNNILSKIELPSEKKYSLNLSLEAKIGYFIFFYNIILTTLLGIAFGFSSLFGSGKFKIFTLIIIFIFSAIISILVTWLNGKHIKNKNSQAFICQKIYKLELSVIHIVLDKIEKKIKKNKKKILDLTENVSKIIRSASYSDTAIDFSQFLKELNYFRQISKNEFFSTNVKTYLKPYQAQFSLKSLTYLRSYAAESPLKIKKWLANSWSEIIPTSFTTLFGSFSSCFILYNSIPSSIHEEGYEFQWENIIYSKYILILISILIAIYFTFSHAKLMYTHYMRDHALKQIKIKIHALEMKHLYREYQNDFLLKNLTKARRLKKYVNNIILEKTLVEKVII